MSDRQKNTGKRNKVLAEVGRELAKNKEKNMCDCCHTRRGEVNVVKSKDRKSAGDLRYLCRACEKKLNLNRLPAKTTVRQNPDGTYDVSIGYMDALEAVDSMIDAIKMSLNLEKEREVKIANHMAETQYRVRNNIPKLYEAVTNKNSNRGNNDRDEDRHQGWGKAEITGR